MIVWIIYDPLLEKVVSAHKTEEGADNRCDELNEKEKRDYGYYPYENDWYELED